MSSRRPIPPASRPMAFLSDIHGNLEGLDAVLDVLERREVRDIFSPGDLLFGGDQALEVWQRLERLEARCTRGVSDSALVLIDPDSLRPEDEGQRSMAERFVETRRSIGDLVVEQLRRLPELLRVPMIDGRELVMVHGSPADASVEITHDMSDDEMRSLLADDPADIIVCGGSHVPFQRVLEEVHVVNVGSVGAAPEGRVAHYTIITPRMDGTEVLQNYVEY